LPQKTIHCSGASKVWAGKTPQPERHFMSQKRLRMDQWILPKKYGNNVYLKVYMNMDFSDYVEMPVLKVLE